MTFCSHIFYSFARSQVNIQLIILIFSGHDYQNIPANYQAIQDVDFIHFIPFLIY